MSSESPLKLKAANHDEGIPASIPPDGAIVTPAAREGDADASSGESSNDMVDEAKQVVRYKYVYPEVWILSITTLRL